MTEKGLTFVCKDCRKTLLPQKNIPNEPFFTHYEWSRMVYGPPRTRNEIMLPIYLCKDCKMKRLRQEISAKQSAIQKLQNELEDIGKM